jgi:hypothetical protein
MIPYKDGRFACRDCAHTVRLGVLDKDLRMAARYQHLSPAFLADAVAKLDDAFDLDRHPNVTAAHLLESTTAASA